MTTRRALIYCRISQDREGGGLAVERQRKDCEALAERLGWTVVGVHVDNDTSAYSGKPRPAYKAVMDALEAGHADAVLVWHTDRLHRSPVELEAYVALCERRNVTTMTVQAGELDLATPSGRMVARQLGAVARYEVEHKSARTRRAQRQAAEKGQWLGGRIPLGWRKKADGTVVLDHAPARRIKRATEDVLAGASLGSIVTAWNDEGFRTATDKDWNYQSLRQVLTRARNAGLSEYNGEAVGTSEWPAIVSVESLTSIRSLLADPSRRKSRSNRARWLLAGIATCGAEGCGQPLRSATIGRTDDGGNRVYYRCRAKGTGHVARNARDLDEHVIETVAAWLARDIESLTSPTADDGEAAELQAEAVALRERLTEAAATFADGLIGRDQLATITARVNERLATIEAMLAATYRGAAAAALVAAGDPEAAWRSAPIDRQRAILRELVEVRVQPRGKAGPREYDPEFTVVRPR